MPLNIKSMSVQLSVLLTVSEIIPRQTSKLAFKNEEWGQLEGKQHSAGAPAPTLMHLLTLLRSGSSPSSLVEHWDPCSSSCPPAESRDQYGSQEMKPSRAHMYHCEHCGERSSSKAGHAKPGTESLACKAPQPLWRTAAVIETDEGLQMVESLCSKARRV